MFGKKKGDVFPCKSRTEVLEHFRDLNGTAPNTDSDADRAIFETLEGLQSSEGENEDQVLDSKVTKSEIKRAISNLKNKKAPGAVRRDGQPPLKKGKGNNVDLRHILGFLN